MKFETTHLHYSKPQDGKRFYSASGWSNRSEADRMAAWHRRKGRFARVFPRNVRVDGLDLDLFVVIARTKGEPQ